MSDDVTKRVNVVFQHEGSNRVIQAALSLEAAERKIEKASKKVTEELERMQASGAITGVQFKALQSRLHGYQSQLQSMLTVQRQLSVEDRNTAKAVKEAAVAEAQRAKAVEASRQATYKAMVAQDKYNQSLNASNARGKSNDAARGLYGSNDEAIRARQAESKAFSQGLQERLRGEQKLADSQAKLTAGSKQYAEHLPRLRYALYDVSSTFAIAGAAMLAFTGAVLGASITMDRRFADVIRTSGTYMDETGQKSRALRDDFNDLFTSLPADWATLTQIGTLGGQLGVASESLAEFTRLVTMFSSTTDVSAEAAATAFGRLSELLDVSASQYENLGSAILAVGTSSVATESQIINTSQQIASMGDFAGFSADQVIGLSSSLASLGIQPELARGTITRLFTNVSVAIANGGERLDEFGRLIGESGETFKKAWGEDASGTLERVFAGLSQIEGSGAITTLKDLGITAARDVPTILKLAQNHKLLSEQMDIAESSFQAGTALQDQYGVVAETVSSKLLILKNSVQLLFAEIGGGSGALAPLIDGLTTIVKGFASMADNDVAQSIGLIVLGFTALAGVLALTAGGAARTAASMIALKTAMLDATGATVATSGATGTLAFTGNVASKSMWGLATSIKGVKLAMIGTGIGAALVLIGSAIAYFVGKADEAKESNDALVGSFSQALTEDTASGNGIRTLTVDLSEYNDSTKTVTLSQQAWNRILAGASTYVEEMGRAVREAAGEVESLNVAIGEATVAEFMKTFTQDEDLRTAFQEGLIPDALDFQVLAETWAKGGDKAATAYIDSFYKPEELKAAIAKQKLITDSAFVDFGVQQTPASKAIFEQQDQALAVLQARMDAYKEVLGILSDNNSAFAKSVELAAFSQRVQGGESENATGKLRDHTEAIRDAIDAQTESISTALDVESAIASLGQSLGDGGNDWSQYTEAGRANLEALMGTMEAIEKDNAGNPQAIANDFQALFNMLVNGGFASAEQLQFLSQSIVGLKNVTGATVVSSGRDFSSFFSGWSTGAQKAAKSTKAAKKEVVTLVDYASDLAKVWDRAFDIRFESTSTFDKITSTFQGLRDAAEEAAQNIADLGTEISGIQTDIGTQQYFLGIAIEYGDSLRAAEIQQTILELQDELKDKQGELSKEQAKNSKTLQGNSKEAIANRGALEDLTDQYLDHLKALAASGMSQDALARSSAELRQDFVAQATALGFAEQDLRTYSAVFDDVAIAISNVPRNITVTADVNPAIQALNEFQAALDATRANAIQPIPSPPYDDSKARKEARGAALYSQILMYRKALELANYAPAKNDIMKELTRLSVIYGGGNYYTGGFTGRGGMYEEAGTVHRGEYVVPKRDVNQRTGLPYADAFQRLSKGIPGATSMARGGYASGSASPGVVDLSARSIQHLANAVEKYLVLDGRIVSQSVNRQNTFATQNGAY